MREGAAADLEKPYILFENRPFNLIYNEIIAYAVRIDLWTWQNYTFNDYFGTVEKSLFKLIREGGFGEHEQESRQIRFSKHRKVINGWRLIPSRDVHRDGSDGSLATQLRRENQVLQ